METLKLNHDIQVMYLKAASFPDGIAAAHERLHARVEPMRGRRYFGISRPEKGEIVYKACAEEMKPGEGKRLRCETMTIRKGEYISVTIKDYTKKIDEIDTTFKMLLRQPGLDPNGYCVEWYLNDRDVTCMIRLEN